MNINGLWLLCFCAVVGQMTWTNAARHRRAPQIPEIAVDPTAPPLPETTTNADSNATEASAGENTTALDASVALVTSEESTNLTENVMATTSAMDENATSSEVPDGSSSSDVSTDAPTTTTGSSNETTTTEESSGEAEEEESDSEEDLTTTAAADNTTVAMAPEADNATIASTTAETQGTTSSESEEITAADEISAETASSEGGSSSSESSGDSSSSSSESEELDYDDDDNDIETEILYSFSDFTLDEKFRQELKMFKVSLQLLEELANETATFPDNYKNTSYEIVDIDGKPYRLEKTVVKQGNNESSLYFKMVSVFPEERKKRYSFANNPSLNYRFKRSNGNKIRRKRAASSHRYRRYINGARYRSAFKIASRR